MWGFYSILYVVLDKLIKCFGQGGFFWTPSFMLCCIYELFWEILKAENVQQFARSVPKQLREWETGDSYNHLTFYIWLTKSIETKFLSFLFF